MAIPTGTFETYDTVGIREDLTDVISMISPTKRPFMSNIARGTATQTLHEFQTDELAAANPDNASIEGDDEDADVANPTSRFANRTQIFKKIARVSGTDRAVDAAGRADELDYQVYKRLEEVGRDVEAALLSGNGASAGDGSSGTPAARKLAGAGRWLWFNNENTGVTGQVTPAVTSGAPGTDVTNASTPAAVSETRLKNAIQGAWQEGGDIDLIMAAGTDKVVMSGFPGIATQYKENTVGPAAIIGAADVYVSDFGTHYIVASHFMPVGVGDRYVLCLDTEQWETCYLRPITRTELSKTGDSDRVQVLGELTLQCTNHKASAKVSGTG